MDNKNKRNIVEVAKKKRHIYLLEKAKNPQSLSPKERNELDQYEHGEVPEYVVSSQKVVAKIFHKSVRTIQIWVTNGMPVRDDGKYDLSEIYGWRKKVEEEERADNNKKKWKDDHDKWKAKQAELRYQQMIGELVSVEEVKEGRIKRILAIKRHLLQLPVTMAPLLEGLTAREMVIVIRDKINMILDRFAGDVKEKRSRGSISKKPKKTTKKKSK